MLLPHWGLLHQLVESFLLSLSRALGASTHGGRDRNFMVLRVTESELYGGSGGGQKGKRQRTRASHGAQR